MHYLDKIRKLYNLPASNNLGFFEAEIQVAEKRLGIVLPQALKSYYLAIGREKTVNGSHNFLFSPMELRFTSDGYLCFLGENQGVVIWGIKQTDLLDANPKIYGTSDTFGLLKMDDDKKRNWFLEADTVEDFLLSMAFWNATMGGLENIAFTDIEEALTPKTIQKIESNWEEHPKINHQQMRFFTNDYKNILILTSNEDGKINGLYVAAFDEKVGEKILDTLNIDWSLIEMDGDFDIDLEFGW